MKTATEQIAAITLDPNASFWFKLAATGLGHQRNPLKAEREALRLLILARTVRRESTAAPTQGASHASNT